MKMITKSANNALKFARKNPLLVAAAAVLLYILYMRNYESFRPMHGRYLHEMDTDHCNEGDCGMAESRFKSHRAKVERGAVEYVPPPMQDDEGSESATDIALLQQNNHSKLDN